MSVLVKPVFRFFCNQSTTYVVADVKALRDPVVGNAAEGVRQTVDVLGRGTAVGVNIALKCHC